MNTNTTTANSNDNNIVVAAYEYAVRKRPTLSKVDVDLTEVGDKKVFRCQKLPIPNCPFENRTFVVEIPKESAHSDVFVRRVWKEQGAEPFLFISPKWKYPVIGQLRPSGLNTVTGEIQVEFVMDGKIHSTYPIARINYVSGEIKML